MFLSKKYFLIWNTNFPKCKSGSVSEVIFTRKVYNKKLWPSSYIIAIIHITCRGSHRRCSVKKSILKNSTKLTGKHLCWNFFFNKVAGLITKWSNTIKQQSLQTSTVQHRCFPLNFVKFLRTRFFKEHLPMTASKLGSYCVWSWNFTMFSWMITAQKMKFSIKKSLIPGNCGCGHIYWRNP